MLGIKKAAYSPVLTHSPYSWAKHLPFLPAHLFSTLIVTVRSVRKTESSTSLLGTLVNFSVSALAIGCPESELHYHTGNLARRSIGQLNKDTPPKRHQNQTRLFDELFEMRHIAAGPSKSSTVAFVKACLLNWLQPFLEACPLAVNLLPISPEISC
jgi:hypothetical protein